MFKTWLPPSCVENVSRRSERTRYLAARTLLSSPGVHRCQPERVPAITNHTCIRLRVKLSIWPDGSGVKWQWVRWVCSRSRWRNGGHADYLRVLHSGSRFRAWAWYTVVDCTTTSVEARVQEGSQETSPCVQVPSITRQRCPVGFLSWSSAGRRWGRTLS